MASFAKLVRCDCLKLLCKRVPTELTGEYYLHVRHRGYEIFAYNIRVICPSCGREYDISAENGKEQILKAQKQE